MSTTTKIRLFLPSIVELLVDEIRELNDYDKDYQLIDNQGNTLWFHKIILQNILPQFDYLHKVFGDCFKGFELMKLKSFNRNGLNSLYDLIYKREISIDNEDLASSVIEQFESLQLPLIVDPSKERRTRSRPLLESSISSSISSLVSTSFSSSTFSLPLSPISVSPLSIEDKSKPNQSIDDHSSDLSPPFWSVPQEIYLDQGSRSANLLQVAFPSPIPTNLSEKRFRSKREFRAKHLFTTSFEFTINEKQNSDSSFWSRKFYSNRKFNKLIKKTF